MNPKNIRYPHSWKERRPLLHEGIFFVPDFYENHDKQLFPSLDSFFSEKKEICIEYCSGNGHWIVDQALKGDKNWIGVEWRFDRSRKIWSKRENNGLKNLLIVCGEALTFTKNYLSEKSVDSIFINFPDPWPKQKHAKNRLFQKVFIEELVRIAKPAGELMAVTDDVAYSEQMIKEVGLSHGWSCSFPNPHFVTEMEGYGSSSFEALWRSKGRKIRYLKWKKDATNSAIGSI